MPRLSAADQAAIFAQAQDPFWFFRHVLGWTPTPAACNYGYTEGITPDQRRVVESVLAHRRTATPAGVGVGKTRIAAGLVLWFLFTHVGSKVVTTAPTSHQVENLLWREIRTAYAQARVPLGGRCLTAQLDVDTDWFALGFSPAVGREEETATRAQGIHAPYVLAVVDEATGVHASVLEAFEGVAVGAHDRLLFIGNPTDPTSAFKAICDSGTAHVVTLSAWDHPNVRHDDPAIIPGAVTRAWVAEHEASWGGPESALARAKIRGLWPEQGDDMLISLAWVEAAQARWIAPTGPPSAGGCDVARTGSDETIIQAVYAGGVFGIPTAYHEPNLMATVGRLVTAAFPVLATDDSGVGGGVTDRLAEQGVPVMGVNAAQAAEDRTRFANARAEMYWHLREALRLDEVALPPDARLAGDLTNLKWKQDSTGRILLEPKDAIRSRLKRSPDRGDAAALGWRAYRWSTMSWLGIA